MIKFLTDIKNYIIGTEEDMFVKGWQIIHYLKAIENEPEDPQLIAAREAYNKWLQKNNCTR